ncbi:MAG: fimbrillin family protein, partial [Bacteroidaceae bacterium]|nr:fimbrillin family protein [Bacteroidaceae bacterium]
MKKILYSIFSAVALLGIAACSNNDGELLGSLNMGGTPNAPTTIVATTESSATTRTALQSDGENGYNVVWSEGDKITLQGSNSPTEYPPVEYALKEGAGTTEGKFEPVADAIDWTICKEIKAFYAVKDMKWPAVQTYRGEDVISNAPMYCSVYNQYAEPNLEFKNMG